VWLPNTENILSNGKRLHGYYVCFLKQPIRLTTSVTLPNQVLPKLAIILTSESNVKLQEELMAISEKELLFQRLSKIVVFCN
jgi:hypothetical protein